MTINFPALHLTVTTDSARLTIHDDDGQPAHLTSDQIAHIAAVLSDVACDLSEMTS